MSDIKWVKLSTAMFDDEKIRVIESQPAGHELCLIWIKLIILAGKVNDNGCIYLTKDIPYTEDTLANIFNHSVEMVKLALKSFEQLGMLEVLSNKRIALVNWEKHQNIEGLERVRELTRLRTRRYRQRLIESNATVTSRDAIELELDKELELKNNTAPTRSTESVQKVGFDFTTGLFENIEDALVERWQDAYPATNVERELKKMAEWLLSNPNKRKKNYRRFITNWLERSQERGGK